MNKQEVQKILRAWDECCELKTEFMSDIDVLSEGWIERIELCCNQWNSNLDDIIDILEDWAADYSATWTNFLCQEEDNEVIGYEIVYQNYLCQQVDVTTTTSTTIVTTTTTVDPDLEEWTITYSDYLCQQVDDPSVTTTTTIGEKSAVIGFSALWSDFLCGLEDNPLIVTTTTTISGTTTTSTTVDPEDVEFIASWTDFQCELEDNPLLTTTTSTTTINEDDVEWIIVYSDYLCQQTDVTTTSTTSTTSTTTLIPVTTTTTTESYSCPGTISGTSEYATEYNINLGATIGKVTLMIDSVDAPDRFVVEWNGSEVIDTGYRGDSSYQIVLYQALILLGEPVALIEGSRTGTFTFNKTTSNPIATVKVYAPLSETNWSFTLSCPVKAALVTTTSTTIGETITAAWTDFMCEQEDNGITTTTTTITTIPATTTTTSIRENSISCGETASGGTAYPFEVWITDMGATTGYVTLTYDMNEQPDKFIVEIDGLEVLNTGYRGDISLQSALDAKLAAYGLPSEPIVGNETGTASFFKASSTTIAIIKVYAPLEETTWSFSVACPDGSTSTTSTSTTTTTSTTTITVAPVTTTTTTSECVTLFNIDGDYIGLFYVASQGMTAPQISASYADIGELHIPATYLGGTTDLYVSSRSAYTFGSSEARQVSINYADNTKVIDFQIYSTSIISEIVDISCLSALHECFFNQASIPNVITTQIILPQTVGTRTIYDALFTYYPGCAFRIDGFMALLSVDVPNWVGRASTIGIYNSQVSGIIDLNGWEGSKIDIADSVFGSIDMSGIHFVDSENVMDTEGYENAIRINGCTFTDFTSPSNVEFGATSDVFYLSVDGNTISGHIDITLMETVFFSNADSEFDINLENNNLTAAQINRILTEMDNIAVTRTGGAYEVWLSVYTGNTAPDSTSGGYNGTAAIASLGAKGYTVN